MTAQSIVPHDTPSGIMLQIKEIRDYEEFKRELRTWLRYFENRNAFGRSRNANVVNDDNSDSEGNASEDTEDNVQAMVAAMENAGMPS